MLEEGQGDGGKDAGGAPVASAALACPPALQLTASPGLGGTGGSAANPAWLPLAGRGTVAPAGVGTGCSWVKGQQEQLGSPAPHGLFEGFAGLL